MSSNSRFRQVMLAVAVTILLPMSLAEGQTEQAKIGDKPEVVKATTSPKVPTGSVSPTPIYMRYRGISIGMTIDSVRAKLDHLKEKSDTQDVFVFSDKESAQVYYKEGKVMAVSANYAGRDSTPPTPKDVLGEDLQAKADGSIYELKRYPTAGCWVSYSRAAGNDPLVSITIQKTSP